MEIKPKRKEKGCDRCYDAIKLVELFEGEWGNQLWVCRACFDKMTRGWEIAKEA